MSKVNDFKNRSSDIVLDIIETSGEDLNKNQPDQADVDQLEE